MTDIKHLDVLLEPHLESDTNITDCKITPLTALGENYGSLMLAVDVKLKNLNEQETILKLVAKKIPENPWLQDAFQIQYTFVKEINFYNTILPTLTKFQTEQGMEKVMDFFPRYFGGRKNLKTSSDEVDEDGVLLLENLKARDYITVDRNVGFDWEVAKLLLADLAVFHAVPIALRIKRPEVFKESVYPHLKYLYLFDDDVKCCEDKMLNKYHSVTGGDKKCSELYDRVKEAVMTNIDALRFPDTETQFSTIIHNDFWVNNTMLKMKNGKPIDNKMIDFQLIEYGSFGRDLIFFLFSSVQTPVIASHYDDLVRLYYEKFIGTLEELNCDVSRFTFETFEEELATAARQREFFHLMFMLKPIFASTHELKDLKDYTEEDLKNDYVSQRHIDKCCFIIKEFSKRNWI